MNLDFEINQISLVSSQQLCSRVYYTYFFPQECNNECEPNRNRISVSYNRQSIPCWHKKHQIFSHLKNVSHLWHVSISRDNFPPMSECCAFHVQSGISSIWQQCCTVENFEFIADKMKIVTKLGGFIYFPTFRRVSFLASKNIC